MLSAVQTGRWAGRGEAADRRGQYWVLLGRLPFRSSAGLTHYFLISEQKEQKVVFGW